MRATGARRRFVVERFDLPVSQDLSGGLAGVVSVLEDDHSINGHHVDTGRVGLRLVVGGHVGQAVKVHHDDVGGHALGEPATV